MITQRYLLNCQQYDNALRFLEGRRIELVQRDMARCLGS